MYDSTIDIDAKWINDEINNNMSTNVQFKHAKFIIERAQLICK